ncbi:MAG: G-D-S-L family lipolytic protein [Flavobacteriaceae bacterium]|nr:G-D-S-L family lipolytic protein [Flavobacteriaceae bacterium]
MKLKYIWLLLIFVGFIACDEKQYDVPDYSPPALEAGSVDFSTFVAVGNSLTAGYTDGALFKASQNNSFPNIMANKMALVGGSENFTQPMMNDNNGGLLVGGQKIQNQRFYFDGVGPALIDGEPTTDILNAVAGPYNNMGVPGAKSFHLLANGYGSLAGLAVGEANPYFVRMASSPNASVMEDAMSQNPTFFSLWIGNNDVLGYALSGGSGVNQAGNFDPSTYGGADITDPNVFAQVYNGLVATLTSGGAKGVVANIPYVTTIPHFTAVPFNPLDPTNPAFGPQIPVLNATFAQLNQAYAYLGSLGVDVSGRSIYFSETEASAVVIHDESLPNLAAHLAPVLIGGGLDPLTAGLLANQYGQSRQATENDLLLLTSSSVIATLNEEYFSQLVSLGVPQEQAGQLSVNGVTYPMRDKWVLIPGEQDEIKIATDQFNVSIKNIASAGGLAFIDANAIMQQMADGGFKSGNFTLTSDLVLGGAFSLDGVHLTARGYAAVANEMFKAIDATYGSNFKAAKELVDIGEYPAFYPKSMP